MNILDFEEFLRFLRAFQISRDLQKTSKILFSSILLNSSHIEILIFNCHYLFTYEVKGAIVLFINKTSLSTLLRNREILK